ncbi:hypothetical protein PAXRUDRAFT_176915, partial [Paxillus rubicundulus Ve08.2h10]
TLKDDTPTASTSVAICVIWEMPTNPGHTSKLVKWLVDHLVDCIMLFSENKSTPRPEGRALGKMKVEICMVITEVIFKDDGDWVETFKDHPVKFSKAIQDRLGTLKKSYHEQAVKFTQTGNGVMLDAEEAVENKFLWYSDLHSLWRGIPSYTPKAIVNSMPGASHGMQLLALVQPKSAPSATTTSDTPAETPTASQGVPPPPSGPPSASPPSGPPSAPPSVPEPPQVIRPPIELPSSTVGQDKGKQRANEPPWPWDDVDINIDVDVDVDMDMGGEEDLYKDDADVDTNRYQGQKCSVSCKKNTICFPCLQLPGIGTITITPSPHAVHIPK